MDSSKITKSDCLISVKNNFIVIPASRYKILSISHLYKSIEHCILNDLHQFDLLDNISFKKHDVKKIFYHHIVKAITSGIFQSSDMCKIICIYDSNDIKRCKLLQYSSIYKIISFIDTVVRKIFNLLPICIYYSTVDSITKYMSSVGLKRELIFTLTDIYDKLNKQTFTFSKAKSFIKNYELTYLDKELFGKLKSKNLLI